MLKNSETMEQQMSYLKLHYMSENYDETVQHPTLSWVNGMTKAIITPLPVVVMLGVVMEHSCKNLRVDILIQNQGNLFQAQDNLNNPSSFNRLYNTLSLVIVCRAFFLLRTRRSDFTLRFQLVQFLRKSVYFLPLPVPSLRFNHLADCNPF